MTRRKTFHAMWSAIALLALLLGGARATTGAPPGQGSGGRTPTTLPPGSGLYIRLTGYVFDPLAEGEPASLPADGRLSEPIPGERGTYLVQYHGPVLRAWVEALAAAGADVLDYVPDYAFIARMDAAARAAVEGMDVVRWVGLYQPGYRLAPSLRDPARGSVPAEQDESLHLTVVLFPGEDVSQAAGTLQEMGGTVLGTTEGPWKSKIDVQIPSSQVNAAARLDGVSWIEPHPEWVLLNDRAAGILGARDVWDTHGLRGAGQVVAVCDTGLDQGSTSPASLHDDFENGSGGSRVLAIHDLVGDGANDVQSGHGTHVAGSVLGNGARSGSTPGSHVYPSTAYVGTAPEASLVVQAVENNVTEALSGLPDDLNDLFNGVLGDGARIHTNSWGSDSNGAYTASSREVDEFVWDHKDFTVLFAAGNAGIDSDGNGVVDPDSLNSPGTAKNCITVGATENDRPSIPVTYGQSWPSDFGVDPIRSDRTTEDTTGMAAFSSRGPTNDGRVKPDLVAPGTFVASARSSLASSSGWAPINSSYVYMGGTSMATPLVAGAAALVREYYVSGEGIVPSAALIKATLIQGATDIDPGQYGTGSTREIPGARPTNVAGWGRVNVERALYPPAPRSWIYVDESAGLHTGYVHSYPVRVWDPSEPLAVTLAWSDYPGSLAASGRLVNDLDLEISGPGGAAAVSIDRVNNVVHLDYLAPSAGPYTITVRGYNVPKGPQPYALVVSGSLNPTGPLVTGITPDTASNTGSGSTLSATISGENLKAGAAVTLTKPGQPSIAATDLTVIDAQSLTCTLDLSGAAPGPWSVMVTNPDSKSGALPDAFTVTDPAVPRPAVTGITPANGLNNAPLHVASLSGSDFATLGTPLVKLVKGGLKEIAATNVTVVSSTTLACDLDLREANIGPRDVVVINPDTQVGVLVDEFTVEALAPAVTGITPASGAGQIHIDHLSGSDFYPGAAVALTRAGEPTIDASGVYVMSSSALACDLDLTGAASGPWTVEVTNVDGKSGQLVDGLLVRSPVHLPVIYRNAGTGLRNGDFELGPTVWMEDSSNGYGLILPAEELVVPPHSGHWAAWLGGLHDDVSSIRQQTTVPSSYPYLAYWHWIASEDACGWDDAQVLVDGAVASAYSLCARDNTGGWVKRVLDLSAYAGRSVSLQFRTETDESLNSNLFVDDVSFQASATAGPSQGIPLEPLPIHSTPKGAASGLQGRGE